MNQIATQAINLHISGKKLRTHIQKKPFTQRLAGTDYTYSILPKKQRTFLFTNDRFLILKGLQSISYSRQLSENVHLPFRSQADIPPHKVIFPLQKLQQCTTEQQKLIIQFSTADRQKWQFICNSKFCAHQWKRRIQIAINQLQRWKVSKIQRYQDYLAEKRHRQEMERINMQKQTEKYFTPPQQETKKNTLNPSSVIANTIDILIKPEEQKKPVPELVPMALKYTNSMDVDPPSPPPPPRQEPQRQETFSPNQNDLNTLGDLLTHEHHESPLIPKSVSTLNFNARENIKSQIALLRRNWLEQLIAHQQETQLFFDFQKYVQKIIEVVVSELHMPLQNKIFPFRQTGKDYVNYLIDDIQVQIYFYSQQQLQKKHPRQKYASRQFKNYDYFLQSTQNEGILLVPFMTMFEYKGFTGMAKTVVGGQNSPYANRQCLQELNLVLFREDSRIDPRIMLDENKCKIVQYQSKRTSLNQKDERVYFIQRFTQFLPSQISQTAKQKFVLRPELIQDPSLQDYTFGDRQRQAGPFQIESLIAKKIKMFIETCQKQQDYFTNSKQLSNMMHSFGLNVRHLGIIYSKSNQTWLRKILQSQIAARCIKHFFRYDMQNCILNQTERIDPRQRQSERQRKRAIAFLNILMGNSEHTFHLWRSLNHYCRNHFEISLWEDKYDDINVNWLLQALQSHLKIEMSDDIHRRYFFKSTHTFSQQDFIKFQPEVNIYNLDFTQAFEQIYSCLDYKNGQHFSQLCKMMTHQTKKDKPYLFLLKEHPIYNSICQYFLYFITPDEYHQFYSSLDQINLPSKFAYECHLTQIKWFIKNRSEMVTKPINFILNSGKRWLGEQHPLFVKMNHILAQYYMDSHQSYHKALQHAQDAVQMQQIMNDGDNFWMWKDYYLVGKIHTINTNYESAFPLLLKAKELVDLSQLKQYEHYAQMVLTISRTYFQLNNLRQAYAMVRELYNQLRDNPDEEIQFQLIQCVKLIKIILEKNQQYEAYYKFVEGDYSKNLVYCLNSTYLMREGVKLVIVPYLKYVIHQNINIRNKIFGLIQQLLEISTTEESCCSFLDINIRKGRFPFEFFNVLRDMSRVIDVIYSNNMIDRWISFNRMSNQTLLERVGGSELSREFSFMAEFTAVLGLLGEEARREFVFMQK